MHSSKCRKVSHILSIYLKIRKEKESNNEEMANGVIGAT
jgi:hypothetical protein